MVWFLGREKELHSQNLTQALLTRSAMFFQYENLMQVQIPVYHKMRWNVNINVDYFCKLMWQISRHNEEHECMLERLIQAVELNCSLAFLLHEFYMVIVIFSPFSPFCFKLRKTPYLSNSSFGWWNFSTYKRTENSKLPFFLQQPSLI